MQQADILHLDETHWYESGKLHWLRVAVSTKTAVFHIGSRGKEELSYLVTEAFMGWPIGDGYAVYRSHSKRQRCLAHLIRKAIAITGAINQKAATIGQWILDDLRELISTCWQLINGHGDRHVRDFPCFFGGEMNDYYLSYTVFI